MTCPLLFPVQERIIKVPGFQGCEKHYQQSLVHSIDLTLKICEGKLMQPEKLRFSKNNRLNIFVSGITLSNFSFMSRKNACRIIIPKWNDSFIRTKRSARDNLSIYINVRCPPHLFWTTRSHMWNFHHEQVKTFCYSLVSWLESLNAPISATLCYTTVWSEVFWFSLPSMYNWEVPNLYCAIS